MAGVEKVNLSGTNQICFTGQSENNSETKGHSLKKYVTAPNMILGSLATVGVLGMADVLICKGKHLNKLTGKAKEFEVVTNRATNAESRASGLETELSKVKEQLNDLIAKLKRNAGIESDVELTGRGDSINLDYQGGRLFTPAGTGFCIPLHRTSGGKEALIEFQHLYSELGSLSESPGRTALAKSIKGSLKANGYKFVEKYDNDIYNTDFFEASCGAPSLKAPKVTIPAIVDKNNECIVMGHVIFPGISG